MINISVNILGFVLQFFVGFSGLDSFPDYRSEQQNKADCGGGKPDLQEKRELKEERPNRPKRFDEPKKEENRSAPKEEETEESSQFGHIWIL